MDKKKLVRELNKSVYTATLNIPRKNVTTLSGQYERHDAFMATRRIWVGEGGKLSDWKKWAEKLTASNEPQQHESLDDLFQQLRSHPALANEGKLRISWNSLEPFYETKWWNAHWPAELADQKLDLQVASFLQAVQWCNDGKEVAWWDKKNEGKGTPTSRQPQQHQLLSLMLFKGSGTPCF